MDLLDRLLALLAERQVPQQDGGVKAEGIHILRRGRVDLASASQHGALGLGLGGRVDVGHPHQLQQPLALGVVFAGDPHRAPRELLDILRRARLLGFLVGLGGLTLARRPFGQLPGLELGRGPVEHVQRFDAIVDHA